MDSNIHKFTKPITVLRYIPQEILWHKAEYRALESRLPAWEKMVNLQNGYSRKGTLRLSHDLLQRVKELPTDVLLLRGLRSASWIELFQRAHKLPFFLNLHRKAGDIWIELKDDYYPNFGSKARDSFDILPLLPGKSVAIHINARYWHSLMGTGTDTHYVENYLYLENLGQFTQAELIEGLEEPFVFKPDKEIDFRQMLY
ncbi:MAG TPA: hypothetical protein PLC89_22685 [Haliscomenobacter sp.]|uniref:hypothetical protein n=1 Tax=Haliscomenobacter sp. TaxID=2717303 RepID=UPI002BBB89D5|nr:hypothetical protein [Haliscomenobacter sp.]HOY20136.1 hypothetical protein [Haliscomenobacter sp.]